MRRGWIIAAGIAAAGLAATIQARAEQVVVSGTATTLAEQQKALKDAKAQAMLARTLSREMDTRAQRTTAEADRLNARAAALAARIQESEADLRAGQARIAIIDRLISAQSARIASQQGPLVRLVAALQSLSRRPTILALLQPGSLTETVHVRAVFERVLPVIRARTAAMRADLIRSRQLQASAVQTARALRTGKIKLGEQRLALGRLEQEKRIAARGLSSHATLEAERATAMGERARDIGDLMQQIEAAGDVRERLASLPGPELRPAAPGQSAPPPSPPAETSLARARGGDTPPPYRLPVIGTLVTGMGELSDSGVRTRGIRLATQANAQVIAPARGRIAFAGPYRGFGQIVIIDHGDGWSSLITDLRRLSVEVGETVDQGAPLAIVGGAARPVVTVELRRQGRPVDIIAIMNARP